MSSAVLASKMAAILDRTWVVDSTVRRLGRLILLDAPIINWNIAWGRPETPRGTEILRRVGVLKPQVICLTEGQTDFLPEEGHLIYSTADYGYRAPPTRRKVLLWSKHPWDDVDDLGSESLPAGRFIAGSTVTDAGSVRCIGVCIPWRHAHVGTGRRDRKPGQDHVTYLCGLIDYLRQAAVRRPIVLGDFNQTVPRTSAPKEAWDGLSELFSTGLSLATSGLRGDNSALTIDHVAVGPALVVRSVGTLSNEAVEGSLSDHFGVTAVLAEPGDEPNPGR